ncbi:MAG TPA: hypothetical protein VF941_23805 [Clostridia bacterium]
MSESEHKCLMESRIRDLELGQAETKVYMKQVLEEVRDIKTTLSSQDPHETKQLSPIVIELIKLVSNCVMILGAIVGAAKVLGK